MSEFKSCPTCYGNKTIVGIGYQKKDCHTCNGVGRIVDNEATAVAQLSQSTLTDASLQFAKDNEELQTTLGQLAESHTNLNAENEQLKAKQAQHDAELEQANKLHDEIKAQHELVIKQLEARTAKAESELADAKDEIKKLKAKQRR